MLKSIIITSFRNIFRNRSFSLINLIGLSVSMSLGMLIILVVREQYTFDNFHADSDRIYRVNTRALRTTGDHELYASSPLPIGSVLKQGYSFAEEVVRIDKSLNGDVEYGTINVPLSGLIVDPPFLQMFNFPMKSGSHLTALKDPNNIVLTSECAEKIFGKQDPMGKVVKMKGYGEFVVAGVLAKFPSKTHFTFEALASFSAMAQWEMSGTVSSSTDNWNNYYSGYNYFKLKQGHSREEVEKALSVMSKKYYSNNKLEARDRGYEFYLHELEDITPGPELSNQMGNGLPEMVSIFLGVLAAIVMIMACFNYTNLMIAKSLSRAKEIGVRKVVGAQRWQVFVQFIGETIIFSLVALAISYVFLQMLKPAFMQLHITQEFSVDPREGLLVYLIFVLFAIAVGVLAGALPASYLSAFRPAKVLKDAGALKVYSKLSFRKVLMVAQFTLSIVFVIIVMVVYQQISFMVDTDYGINDKDILNVRLQGMEFQKLAGEVRSLPGVESIGALSHSLGTWSDASSEYRKAPQEQPFSMRDFVVDDEYLSSIEVEFLAGKNFKKEEQGEQERHVILNVEALKMFDFPDPAAAIGKPVFVDDSVMLTVIGVVKNFHFRPLTRKIDPLALRHNSTEINILSVKISGGKDQVIAAIAPIWKKLDPIHPLEYKMMSEEIDKAYEDAGFLDILTIVGYITFLAIMLACLGMLGMVMYSAKTKVKEIGVRKVMGAGILDITLLLSGSFLWIIAIAMAIGVPISYFLGTSFLNLFAYRIDITIGLVLFGTSIIIILALLTICSQTLSAAVTNPVKSLRYE